MPYFFVSRARPASPFAASFMNACVLEAPDLDTAKANLKIMIAGAVEKGREFPDAFGVVALDDQPRSEHGAVVASFTQLG